MSTILDALEKAKKKQASNAPGSAERLGADSARERRLREEADHHRKNTRMLMGVVVVLVVAGIGAIAVVASRPKPKPADTSKNNLATAGLTVQPTPAPAGPSPTPAPSPTPERIIVTVMATPVPGASPTPQPSATPAPQPQLKASQVISGEDIGVVIGGVFFDEGNSSIMIDGEMVDIGRKHSGIRPLKVHRDSRMIEAEVDDAGQTVVVFIRY